ncbi:pyridine nucleotide-disulfide oxidoreductase [Solimonas sp. K1W22B-7]|nr:pyridine nucleotide-disulfide oxidoreductase [Solimonas sp. K1W22B-7]
MNAEHIVVVGAGQAGCGIATELRKLRFGGRITLIGDETHMPYQRPPLSKAYLAGELPEERLSLVSGQRLREAGIDFRGGVRASGIDRRNRTLQLEDGSSIAYDRMAIATGGRNRALPWPEARADNVFSLRTIDDVRRMRDYWSAGKRLVVIGGGFIGLEVAATAVRAGLQVTVLEAQDRLLSRVTIPAVSDFFEKLHGAAGVTLRKNVQVVGLEGMPQVSAVVLADGTRLAADLVLVGIGLLPNTALAEVAGLEVRDGIVVDECARSSDPRIVAAGDCANHPSVWTGTRLRLESVQNAADQARTAAATLCGAATKPYRALPWFWSDQYDVKLQIAGISAPHDHLVLRGDPAFGAFTVFYFLAGRMIAADSLNRPQDHLFARRAIGGGLRVDPGRIADEAIPLSELSR